MFDEPLKGRSSTVGPSASRRYLDSPFCSRNGRALTRRFSRSYGTIDMRDPIHLALETPGYFRRPFRGVCHGSLPKGNWRQDTSALENRYVRRAMTPAAEMPAYDLDSGFVDDVEWSFCSAAEAGESGLRDYVANLCFSRLCSQT